MAIELPQLSFTELRDTGENPVLLHVPANQDLEILVNCNPKNAPHTLALAVHRSDTTLRVERHDEAPIQVVDAAPLPTQPHIRPYIFTAPVDSVEFNFYVATGMWRYEASSNIANASLLSKFSFLIGNFAVSRQLMQRSQAQEKR